MTDKPQYRSVPTFRNYEDYHDAEQYAHGWNDASVRLAVRPGQTNFKALMLMQR